MKTPVITTVFVTIILLSSFLSAVNFNTYLFVHAETYILLAFCIGFVFVSVNFLLQNRGRSKLSIQINFTDLLVLTLTGYVFIRYVYSPRFWFLPDTILLNSILLASYFYIKNASRNNRESTAKAILYIIAGAGTLQAMYGLLQLSTLLPNLFSYKLGGSFGNPGDLANFLALTSTLVLGLIFKEKRKDRSYFLIPVYALQIAVIGISMARTAWIATLLANMFVLYHFRLKQSLNRLFRQRRRLFIMLLLVLILGSPFLFYKLYTMKPLSADGRLFIWELSLTSIIDNPLFGKGYESFVTEHRQLQINYFQSNRDEAKAWVAGEPMFAFNDFIQFAQEYGLIGLILLIGIIIGLFRTRSEKMNKNLIISKAAVLAVLICMLFSYPMQNPSILICLILLAAIISSSEKKGMASFRLRKFQVNLISAVILAFVCLVAFHSIRSIDYGLRWQKASHLFKEGAIDYINKYEELMPVLKHNRSFLLNYGCMQYKADNYQHCIDHFEKYGYLFAKTDMYIMLGEAYEKTGVHEKAEENYQKASFLVPHKFIPKYKLFNLYLTTGRNEEAFEIARTIRDMKIKVYSETVKSIKTEANEYLSTHKKASL